MAGDVDQTPRPIGSSDFGLRNLIQDTVVAFGEGQYLAFIHKPMADMRSVLAPKSGNYSNEPLTELPITILGLNSFDPEPL